MYRRSAAVYDAIYAGVGKDYAQESQKVREILAEYTRTPISSLLDVACGTGGHLVHLRNYFHVEGVDLNAEMLAAAREKLPDVILHQGNMQDFDLRKTFDALICLFSAIGYADGVAGLNQTLANFAQHTNPGGVILVEPWLLPEIYTEGGVHATHVDLPELKISRINVSRREGDKSVMDMHHLVGTPAGVEHFVERHELTLFTHTQYMQSFRSAHLATFYDEVGIFGRGIYIGVVS
ncbi:MAG: class I SAM-dependent methyltransferase [Anaerolineales bacterium]|nr:class I SAM-dependent methyltransferase [Anaerolineales bacterium]